MGKKKVSKFNDAPSSGRVNRREAHRDKILGDQISKITDEVHNDESVDLDEVSSRVPLSVRVCLWEFGQNDPNRYIIFILLMY